MKRKAVAIVCSSALAVAGMFVFTGANAPTKALGMANFSRVALRFLLNTLPRPGLWLVSLLTSTREPSRRS